ncbi:hypothetical protein [Gramella sp. AN32]|uniref:Uncharacterized protein n=1 Tax=Christiangramia antarctica TaxID=2058158 RepID=A0ABW5X9Y7_9FLAO|nr:hypothetical protein [Gramella sp. AN32]MCM4156440.1 hypothetical protein [Gramella sp. AN32]
MKNVLKLSYFFVVLIVGCEGDLQNERFDANPSDIYNTPSPIFLEQEARNDSVKDLTVFSDAPNKTVKTISYKNSKDNFQQGQDSKKRPSVKTSNNKVDSIVNVGETSYEQNTTALRINKKRNSPTVSNNGSQINTSVNQKENILIKMEILNPSEIYKTASNHTITLQITNETDTIQNLFLNETLPESWKLVSAGDIENLKPNEKKLVLVSFNIPAKAKSGKSNAVFNLVDAEGTIVKTLEVDFEVDKNYELQVYNISAPQTLKAGETINARFGIQNNGNIKQEIELNSTGTITGDKKYSIAPDSTLVIEVSKKTDSKVYFLRNVGSQLDVYSKTSKQTYRAYTSTQIFPSKIEKKDPFFRFPIRASLNYNSHTYKNNHFSTISSELMGDGYLDLNKKHHLNFIIRAPQQQNLKRFGVTDQYSFIYRYNNKTNIYVGDHAYFINRLGFDSRYGMGFRIDQDIKKWTFSTFYSKPRLYSFNSSALYGVKSVYNVSDSLKIGLAIERSQGTIQGVNSNIEANPNESGQIGTVNLNYRNKGTYIDAETSVSLTNEATALANYINLVQQYKNLTYSGTLTIAGKDYFGSIRNSLQYSNNFYYKNNRWNFALGQTISKVNRRLDPLFYAAEPYYENYYGMLGYRFKNRHLVNIRLEQRTREDQMEPKSYYYKEHGINYRYLYSSPAFVLNFSGRLSRTKNLLSESLKYRNTFSHNLNSSYRILDELTLRGSINHNYSNRYGNSNINMNYLRYSLGFNYNMNKTLRINASYNSGFSPEENYLKRDFINANLLVHLNKNHQFEVRANYYENPGSVNKKELLALGKYTYSFGVPLKRVLQQGGLRGVIYAEDESIKVSGIKIIAAGQTILTDKNGRFQLNNLPLGKNYVLIDESSLPMGIVSSQKTSIEVEIRQERESDITLQLIKSANINGTISIAGNKTASNMLEKYFKIENKNFTYHVESNKEGIFQFKDIVPGTYTLNLIRFKENDDFEIKKDIQISVGAGETMDVPFVIIAKERKVKFTNKNFKIGQ